MGTMACKWKNGKDVNGLAASKLKAATQAKNVQQLKAACGNIVGSGKKKCRQGCAARWGVAMTKRATCDDKCVESYDYFESECLTKAGNLAQVYKMKLDRTAARKQCHEGNCPNIPTTWMMTKQEDMTGEVEKQCKSQCDEKGIKAQCEKKWLAEVDLVLPSVESTCFADSKAKECFGKKKTSAKDDQKKCATGGEKTCKEQAEKCNKKGNTDKTFKDAKGFCDERKTMCEEQVTKKCNKEFKTALDDGQAECEKADEKNLADCKEKTLKEQEDKAMDKCKKTQGPKCDKKCKEACDTKAMGKCLKNLESKTDEAEIFCKDFWKLLHDSAEMDPMTGDPIVLLSSKHQ